MQAVQERGAESGNVTDPIYWRNPWGLGGHGPCSCGDFLAFPALFDVAIQKLSFLSPDLNKRELLLGRIH